MALELLIKQVEKEENLAYVFEPKIYTLQIWSVQH